jgi:hypothetical protein
MWVESRQVHSWQVHYAARAPALQRSLGQQAGQGRAGQQTSSAWYILDKRGILDAAVPLVLRCEVCALVLGTQQLHWQLPTACRYISTSMQPGHRAAGRADGMFRFEQLLYCEDQ